MLPMLKTLHIAGVHLQVILYLSGSTENLSSPNTQKIFAFEVLSIWILDFGLQSVSFPDVQTDFAAAESDCPTPHSRLFQE